MGVTACAVQRVCMEDGGGVPVRTQIDYFVLLMQVHVSLVSDDSTSASIQCIRHVSRSM